MPQDRFSVIPILSSSACARLAWSWTDGCTTSRPFDTFNECVEDAAVNGLLDDDLPPDIPVQDVLRLDPWCDEAGGV